MTKPWQEWTDAELADEAQAGIRGQGAVVEATRRLRDSNDKYSRRMFSLTIVLAFLTLILTMLTGVLVFRAFHARSDNSALGFSRIYFIRESGRGPDPGYEVMINGSGAAQLFSCQYMPFQGRFVGRVSSEDLRYLSRLLSEDRYFQLKSTASYFDAPGLAMNVVVNGHDHIVHAADVRESPLTDPIYELGKVIDGIVLTTRWYGRPNESRYSPMTLKNVGGGEFETPPAVRNSTEHIRPSPKTFVLAIRGCCQNSRISDPYHYYPLASKPGI